MGEPAGQDDGVDSGELTVAVPQQLGVAPELPERFDGVELAVGSGEDDDADAGAHPETSSSMRTSLSSMTGFVRKRATTSSTSARAAASDSASIVKRMLLPTVTPSMPVKPRRRQRPLDRRPLRVGDARLVLDLDLHREAHRAHAPTPGQSANARPVMRS